MCIRDSHNCQLTNLLFTYFTYAWTISEHLEPTLKTALSKVGIYTKCFSSGFSPVPSTTHIAIPLFVNSTLPDRRLPIMFFLDFTGTLEKYFSLLLYIKYFFISKYINVIHEKYDLPPVK